MMLQPDLVVIGGGPAGLSAAIAAYDSGVRNLLILEREDELGGILNQCIHNGFGLHTFKEELTGPEYAERYVAMAEERGILSLLSTTVLDVERNRTVTAVNSKNGMMTFRPKAVIIACGCRERPRGAINIAGARLSGIYSAGTAQKYVNMMGYMPGKKVVILGSGDIGLIMARRMKFEGAEVLAVIELMPFSSGLNRNIVQCLDDFGIPLYFNQTVTEIFGRERVEAVAVCGVDENFNPKPETRRIIECDTLLLSVGLIPENELSKKAGITLSDRTGGPIVGDSLMTDAEGIFACGNVLHVHDIVDFVSEESAEAGRAAAAYILDGAGPDNMERVEIIAGAGVRYTVPQYLMLPGYRGACRDITLKFRVAKVFENVRICIISDGAELKSWKKRILVPGEMIDVKLDGGLLGKASGALTIEIRE